MKSIEMKALAIAIASLGLAACGGSGAKTTAVVNPTTGGTATGGTATGGTATGGTATGGTATPGNYASMSGNANSFEAFKTMSAVNDINKFTVEGKTYVTATPGITAGGFVTTNANNVYMVRGGTSFKYARWGFLFDSGTNRGHIYAQGNPATGVPTTGSAVYTGRAVHTNTSLPRELTGAARFAVDFGNKTLTGVVDSGGSNAQFNNIQLSANISGNTFSGTHATSGYVTQGGFYGPGAAELAGVFYDKNRVHGGAYGAVK